MHGVIAILAYSFRYENVLTIHVRMYLFFLRTSNIGDELRPVNVQFHESHY